MSFNVIGNMNTYLKSMQMKTVWDLKKKSGDYDAKGATNIQQMLDQIAGKTEDGSRQQDEKLSEILQKFYAGKKLSSEEREYLRDKAPLVYKELIAIEEEQKAYERELRRCEKCFGFPEHFFTASTPPITAHRPGHLLSVRREAVPAAILSGCFCSC